MRTLSGAAGLCATCRRSRVVGNRRGSRFWLCTRSAEDRRYPRYPRLPVLRCAGYDPGVEPEEEDESATRRPGASDPGEEPT